MAVEAGAETGLFPPDDTVADYLGDRASRVQVTVPGDLASDPDAAFAQTLAIDLVGARARSSRCRTLPGNVVPVAEATGTKIDQVYIGNCSNGTMTDLRQTAEILRGRTIASRLPG